MELSRYCQEENNELQSHHDMTIFPRNTPATPLAGQPGFGVSLAPSHSLPIKAAPHQSQSVGLITQTQVEFFLCNLTNLNEGVLGLLSSTRYVQKCPAISSW